jgi:hypothetical protein
MSVLRHEKETQLFKMVMNRLDEKYNGDIFHYNDAENDVKSQLQLIRKLKSVNTIHESKNIANKYTKHTHIDLTNNLAEIEYSDCPEALLGYSLEFLSVRRIFPHSLVTFLDKNKARDLAKMDPTKRDEATKVFTWVKDRVLNTQFALGNISLDKSSGIFKYNTSIKDLTFGSTLQYMTAHIDKSRVMQIPGTDLKKNLLELSHDYNSLFSYFMAFGFTEFYARCTCPDYIRKYSKRNGISNYFCPHILYSLSQMPYYLIYTLS